EEKQAGLSGPAKRVVEAALGAAVDDVKLAEGKEFAELVARMTAADEKAKKARANLLAGLARLGVAREQGGVVAEVAGQPWGACQVRRFNADVVAQVLLPEMVSADKRANLVDPRLASAKAWRDVYRYDEAGKVAGWTRTGLEKAYEFDAEGRVVVEGKTAAVKYETGVMKGFAPAELRMVVGEK
ncbi:MAG: hypothetical protein ACAI43_17450, partial [Phycisphaerae bacterium]